MEDSHFSPLCHYLWSNFKGSQQIICGTEKSTLIAKWKCSDLLCVLGLQLHYLPHWLWTSVFLPLQIPLTLHHPVQISLIPWACSLIIQVLDELQLSKWHHIHLNLKLTFRNRFLSLCFGLVRLRQYLSLLNVNYVIRCWRLERSYFGLRSSGYQARGYVCNVHLK